MGGCGIGLVQPAISAKNKISLVPFIRVYIHNLKLYKPPIAEYNVGRDKDSLTH